MIKFRLHPENRSIYFKVFILPTLRAMHSFLVSGRVYTWRQAKRANATMLTNLRGKNFGVLIFNLEHLTDSVVAHELFHALMAFAERKKILRNPLFYFRAPAAGQRFEEKLAEVAGELAWQFRWKCKQKGIRIK